MMSSQPSAGALATGIVVKVLIPTPGMADVSLFSHPLLHEVRIQWLTLV